MAEFSAVVLVLLAKCVILNGCSIGTYSKGDEQEILL